jgi:hypothetical protein
MYDGAIFGDRVGNWSSRKPYWERAANDGATEMTSSSAMRHSTVAGVPNIRGRIWRNASHFSLQSLPPPAMVKRVVTATESLEKNLPIPLHAKQWLSGPAGRFPSFDTQILVQTISQTTQRSLMSTQIAC